MGLMGPSECIRNETTWPHFRDHAGQSDFTAVAKAYGMAGVKNLRAQKSLQMPATFSSSATGGIIELDIAVEAITPRTTLSALKAGSCQSCFRLVCQKPHHSVFLHPFQMVCGFV